MALPAARLEEWRGHYDVHVDAILYSRAVLPANFRFADRSENDYWRKCVRFERRCLSALGRFVPSVYRFVFGLSESCRDRLLMKVPERWRGMKHADGFLVELELVFVYKARALMDLDHPYWVVAATDRVVRTIVAMLLEVYEHYRLWWIPPDIIRFARELGEALIEKLVIGVII